MKKSNKNNIIISLFIVSLTIIIFGNFFFKGLYPYPGNYMLAWYQPWKSDHTINQTITLVHKAVADDTFRQLFPYRLLTADLLKHFELPLWNPYNGSGMPLLATMHSGFLNPFNLFFVFLPVYLGWAWYIVTQFILIYLFTYFYCRSLGLNLKSSLFSASIFSLSGFVIVRLLFGEYLYVLAMLPLLLYLIEIFAQNIKTKRIFFIPFIILFMFISGQPQMILYVLTTTSCYALIRIKNIKHLLLFFSQIFFGLGLSAIQLAPTFELYQNAAITTESSKFIFARFLLPIQHLITIIIPNYFGNQATYNYWGAGDYIETISTLGSIPCFFALIYLFTKDKKNNSIKYFYLLIIFISIVLTLNWIGTRLFFTLPIPILSTGIPSRIFILTTFSIAILAGFGFEKLSTEKISLRNFVYKSFPFLIIIFIITSLSIFQFFTHSPCPNNAANIPCHTVALRNTLIEDSIFIIFFFTLFLFFKLKLFFSTKLQLLTILLIIIIGTYNATKFLPFSPKDTFIPQNELITALQNKTKDGRVFGFDDANIKTDFATLFRFYDPNYYDPLYNRRYGELIAYANNNNLLRSDVEINQSATPSADIIVKRERLFNILAVKYFIFKKSPIQNNQNQIVWENSTWVINKNDHSLPHAFLVNNYEIIYNPQTMLNTLFANSFDPTTTALIEKNINYKPSKNTAESNNVKITNYQENKLTINYAISTDKILVLLDNYYPGWKAFIDGQPTTIFRVDYTFRGLVLPKGKHTIKFIYQPDSMRFGIYISLLTLIIYIIFFSIVIKTKLFNRD